MAKIHAPWSEAQVAKLNEWQACGWVHPFTCGYRYDAVHLADAEVNKDREFALVAMPEGWRCPCCSNRQTWAHDYMFEGAPPDPRASLK